MADVQARAVIDASGTWTQPNPLGASGLPEIGGRDRNRYAGQRTVVVGAGHSAATSLLALADLQQQAPATEVLRAVRSATPRPLVGKGSAEADELPARGRLATDLAALIEAGRIELITGFRIGSVELTGDRVRLAGDHFQGDDVIFSPSTGDDVRELVPAGQGSDIYARALPGSSRPGRREASALAPPQSAGDVSSSLEERGRPAG